MSDEVLPAAESGVTSPPEVNSPQEQDISILVQHLDDIADAVHITESIEDHAADQVAEQVGVADDLDDDEHHPPSLNAQSSTFTPSIASHVVITDYRGSYIRPKSSIQIPVKSMLKKTPKSKMLPNYYLEETDSKESLVSVISLASRSALHLRDIDVLEKLREIPTLEQVAAMMEEADDVTLGRLSTVRSEYSRSGFSDKGSFVEPLMLDLSEDEDIDVGAEEEHLEGEEEEDGTADDDEMDELLNIPDIEEEVKSVDERDEFVEALFQRATARKILVDADGDFAAAMERQENERQMLTITEQFMQGLVRGVVDHCEIFDRNSLLRQNLDKMRLADDIATALTELHQVQRQRFFLNRKGVEFYRRRRSFRPISEDNPDTVAADILKYRSSLQNLDLLLSREHETRTIVESQVADLKAEVAIMRAQADDTIKEFETTVRKTLLRETNEKTNDRLELVLDYLLRKKTAFRTEISKLRLQLIQRQHRTASLREQLDTLEDLGNGLHMSDFEHLQTETFALGKKIEERNLELTKLRSRCNVDLHIMAHMRERHHMLRHSIVIQKYALQELADEKNDDRSYLYSLKLQRGKIRDEINELSFQGGLIDKPVLMMDYDQTMDKLEKTRARVEVLRQKLGEAQVRESSLHQRYSVQSN